MRSSVIQTAITETLLQIADKRFTSNVEQGRADADKQHLLRVLIFR